MEHSVEHALIPLINKISDGTDWAVDQAPAVIQEYLNWATASHAVGAAVGFIVFLISFVMVYKECKKHDDLIDTNPIILVPGSIGVLMGGLIGGLNLYQFLYVYLAPKAYLLEKALTTI